MKNIGVVCGGAFALLLLNACAYQQNIGGVSASSVEATAAAETAAQLSTAERIKADVAYLADDARQGREAGTQGYEQAARYVAARMEAIGLEPGIDGAWFQQVPLRTGVTRQDEVSLSITSVDGETTTLVNLENYRLYPSLAGPDFDITAPAVFVGYGVHAPALGHDDFEGLDLTGKIIVYFGGAPDNFDSEKRAHFGSGALTRQEASKRGAIGSIALLTTGTTQRVPWERRVRNPSSASKTWLGLDGEADIAGPEVKAAASLRHDASTLLFEGAKRSFQEVLAEADSTGGAPSGFDLAVTVSMKGAMDLTDVTSPNVIGIIPGNDPALRDEYVVLTAHLDHLGVNEKLQKEGKDGINNGALDNAMGVATMLEAAQRLLAEREVARSVIVLAVTGEEAGLLGADYFAHFPTVPVEQIVANVNLDMPVIIYPFSDVIVFGADHSSLGAIVDVALNNAGVKMSPDPFPEEGIFTRSDHYRFVEKGIPAVYLITGFENGGAEKFQGFLKNNYHKPSDDISQPILYDDAARFADVNFEIARAIANASTRPTWNEGDFFGGLFSGE